MKRANLGLTLIEVAIAIAATVFLFMIAVPAYQAHSARQVVAEALSLAAPAKATVEEYATDHARLPGNGDIALPFVTSKYIASTSWAASGAAGTITIATRAATGSQQQALDGRSVVLTAQYNSRTRSVDWTCGGTPATTVDAKLLPLNCKI